MGKRGPKPKGMPLIKSYFCAGCGKPKTWHTFSEAILVDGAKLVFCGFRCLNLWKQKHLGKAYEIIRRPRNS